MSGENQEFWNTGGPEYLNSNSRMYRVGDCVHIEAEDFDREDMKRYDYSATLKWADYLEVIAKLQKGKKGSLKSTRDNTHANFSCGRDGMVEISLEGSPSPCSSPQGALITGSIKMPPIKLEELLPK